VAADVQPDVVLMDLSMPGLGGVEATRRLLAAHPGLQIVVLTSFSDGVTDRTQAALWAERNGLRRGPS
jgi:CheY-like chemotaxis protein